MTYKKENEEDLIEDASVERKTRQVEDIYPVDKKCNILDTYNPNIRVQIGTDPNKNKEYRIRKRNIVITRDKKGAKGANIREYFTNSNSPQSLVPGTSISCYPPRFV